MNLILQMIKDNWKWEHPKNEAKVSYQRISTITLLYMFKSVQTGVLSSATHAMLQGRILSAMGEARISHQRTEDMFTLRSMCLIKSWSTL